MRKPLVHTQRRLEAVVSKADFSASEDASVSILCQKDIPTNKRCGIGGVEIGQEEKEARGRTALI